jgi:hypothetical protein
MTDLLLQDFKNLSSKKLVQVLLDEQKKMFGEQTSHSNRRGDSRPFLSPLAGLIIKVIRSKEGENVRN